MIRQSNEAGRRKDRLGQEDEDDDDRNGCICSADFGDVRGNDRCVASGSRARKPRTRKPVPIPRVLISPVPISPAPPAGRRDGPRRRKCPGRDIPARIDLQRCGLFSVMEWRNSGRKKAAHSCWNCSGMSRAGTPQACLSCPPACADGASWRRRRPALDAARR